MRTIPAFLKMSLVLGFIVAALSVAVGASTSTQTATQMTPEYKPDDHVFTGTVVTNNLAAKTVTIMGHNPLLREMRAEPVSAKKNEKPMVADAPRVFHVDVGCRISVTNATTSNIANVQAGDLVDVNYRKEVFGKTTALVASVIETAKDHPYDAIFAKKK